MTVNQINSQNTVSSVSFNSQALAQALGVGTNTQVANNIVPYAPKGSNIANPQQNEIDDQIKKAIAAALAAASIYGTTTNSQISVNSQLINQITNSPLGILPFALGSIGVAVGIRDVLPSLAAQKTPTEGMQNVIRVANNLSPLSAEKMKDLRMQASQMLANAKSLEDLLPSNDPLFKYWASTLGLKADREKLLLQARKAIAISLSQIAAGMVPIDFNDMDGTLFYKNLSKVYDSNQKTLVSRMLLQLGIGFTNDLRGMFELAANQGPNFDVDLFEQSKHLVRLGVVNDLNGVYTLWGKEYQERIQQLISKGKISKEAFEWFKNDPNFWANTARTGAFDTLTVVQEWYNTSIDSKNVTFAGTLGGILTEVYGMSDVRNRFEELINSVGIGNIRLVGDELVLPSNALEMATVSRLLRDTSFTDYLRKHGLTVRISERKGVPEYVLQLLEEVHKKTGNNIQNFETRSLPNSWWESFAGKLSSIEALKEQKVATADLIGFIRDNFRELSNDDFNFLLESKDIQEFPKLEDSAAWAMKNERRSKVKEYRQRLAKLEEAVAIDSTSYSKLQSFLNSGNVTGAINLLKGLSESCVLDVTIHGMDPTLNGSFTPNRASGMVEQPKIDIQNIFVDWAKTEDGKLYLQEVEKVTGKSYKGLLKTKSSEKDSDFLMSAINNASAGAPVDFKVNPKDPNSITVKAKPVFPNTLYLEIPFGVFDKGNIFKFIHWLYIQQFFGDSPGTDTKNVALTATMNPLAMPGQPRDLSQKADMQNKSLEASNITSVWMKNASKRDSEEFHFHTLHPLSYIKVDQDGTPTEKGEYRQFVGGISWSPENQKQLKEAFPFFNQILPKDKFEETFHKYFEAINEGRIVRAPDNDYLIFLKALTAGKLCGMAEGFDSKDIAEFVKNPRLFYEHFKNGYTSQFDVGSPFQSVSNGSKWGIDLTAERKNIYHPFNWFIRQSPLITLRGFQAGGGLLIAGGLGSLYLYLKNKLSPTSDPNDKAAQKVIEQAQKAGRTLSGLASLLNSVMSPVIQPFSVIGSLLGIGAGFLPAQLSQTVIPLSVALNMGGWALQNAYWAKANLSVPTNPDKHLKGLWYENKNWANDGLDVLQFSKESDRQAFAEYNNRRLYFGGVDASNYDQLYYKTYNSLVNKNVPKFLADIIGRTHELGSMGWNMLSNPAYLHDVLKPTATRDLVRGKQVVFPNCPHQMLALGSLIALGSWAVSSAVGLSHKDDQKNNLSTNPNLIIPIIPGNASPAMSLTQLSNSTKSGKVVVSNNAGITTQTNYKQGTTVVNQSAQNSLSSNSQANISQALSYISSIPPSIAQSLWGFMGIMPVAFGSPATATLAGTGRDLVAMPGLNGGMMGWGGLVSILGGVLGLVPSFAGVAGGLYSVGQGLVTVGLANENMIQAPDKGAKVSNAFGFRNVTPEEHIQDLVEAKAKGWDKLWGKTFLDVEEYIKGNLIRGKEALSRRSSAKAIA